MHFQTGSANFLKYAFPYRIKGEIKIKLFIREAGDKLNNKYKPDKMRYF
jgi:two-component sensor histidine kinase